MILGRGLLSTAFAPRWQNDEDVLVIAAGVSNSGEQDAAQFERERLLLSRALSEARFRRVVYFGSCAVGNPHERRSPYLEHKARMERMVLEDARGLVLRLPQVVGPGGNPNTLTNFLHARIESGEHFEVWTLAERNLIDVADVALIGEHVIEHADTFPSVVSIADVRASAMLTIVHEMERAMGRSANYHCVRRGDPLEIDTDACVIAAEAVGVKLGPGYLTRLLEKYYG